jgi:hypothetical protein
MAVGASEFRMLAAIAAVGVAAGAQGQTNKPTVATRSLTSGINVVVVRFPASTNVSIFTFLPLGLRPINAGQAQWSHLVEHLVIRSTMQANSVQANAETLPDHMRLDFYGNIGNWQEGLSHQRRWLEGLPFREASLEAEKPKVNQECDFTARNFATHKFAVAAWSQGFRHGQTKVALKGGVLRAKLSEVRRLRDDRLAVSNRVTLCVVGGLEPELVLAEVEKPFSTVPLRGSLVRPANTAKGNLDMTWDLNARHLLLTWPIPDFHQPDHAALIVAAQCLNQSLYGQLKGSSFAGADLATPEGCFFYVSTALRSRFEFRRGKERRPRLRSPAFSGRYRSRQGAVGGGLPFQAHRGATLAGGDQSPSASGIG